MQNSESSQIKEIIEDPSLLWHGHFALASGEHSNVYWKKFRLLEQPEILAALCEPIVQHFQHSSVDLVIGPTLGGVPIAYEVARQLRVKSIYAERDVKEEKRFFRYPAILDKGQRVLIVDDVFMTGWTINQIIDAVIESGAIISGIGIILDRSRIAPSFPYPFFALHHLDIAEYNPADCPLCKKEIPLTLAAGTT